MPSRIVMTALILTLIGCASTPPRPAIDPRPDLSLQPDDKHGVLLIKYGSVPVEENGIAVLHILAVLGGSEHPANTVGANSNIFDVTSSDNIQYLGNIYFEPKFSAWRVPETIEVKLPAGHRRLMNNSSGFTPDFLDIEIKPNRHTFVTIAQYGFARWSYMHEIALSEADFNACRGMDKGEYPRSGKWSDYSGSALKSRVKDYMKAQKINSGANYFEGLCTVLGLPMYKYHATETDRERVKVENDQAALAKLAATYPSWKQSSDGNKKTYDFRVDGIEKKRSCSNEVRICPDGKKVMRTEKNCEFEACEQPEVVGLSNK